MERIFVYVYVVVGSFAAAGMDAGGGSVETMCRG